MSLLHPSSAGAPVGLWFVDGMPVRIVHDGTRYRVVDDKLYIDGPYDTWQFRAQDEWGRTRFFEVRSVGLGWELVRAS